MVISDCIPSKKWFLVQKRIRDANFLVIAFGLINRGEFVKFVQVFLLS